MDAGPDEPEEHYRRTLVHAALRSVVHDLNNPLGTITMAAAALRAARDDEQRAELIDLVEREAMRAGATARSAVERTGLPPVSRTTPVAAVVPLVRDRCRGAGVAAAIADVSDTSLHVAAEPVLLARTLTAFVVDAHRSPGRRTPVRVGWRRDDGFVEVVIEDDGEAVPTERARRPFRPFPAEGETAGRAVGLAVAAGRYHVRSLGGSLDLVPEADVGNTVRLRLPIATPVPAQVTGAASDRAPARRALVVDDDRTMRDMLEVVLRRGGWHTIAAADGRAATSAVSGQPVDLVLLDLHLGTEYGPDIAARLEAQRPGVAQRVVYLSGDVPPSGRIDGRPAIAKPFVLEELYRVADGIAAQGPL